MNSIVFIAINEVKVESGAHCLSARNTITVKKKTKDLTI